VIESIHSIMSLPYNNLAMYSVFLYPIPRSLQHLLSTEILHLHKLELNRKNRQQGPKGKKMERSAHVIPTLGQQLRMCPFLRDTTVSETVYHIGFLDRRQPVSNRAVQVRQPLSRHGDCTRATHMVVRPLAARSSASCTTFSDCESNADVASSKSRTFGSRIKARAIAIRCFCPTSA